MHSHNWKLLIVSFHGSIWFQKECRGAPSGNKILLHHKHVLFLNSVPTNRNRSVFYFYKFVKRLLVIIEYNSGERSLFLSPRGGNNGGGWVPVGIASAPLPIPNCSENTKLKSTLIYCDMAHLKIICSTNVERHSLSSSS